MPATAIACLETPALELTLEHHSPFWDLTLRNQGATTLWVDRKHGVDPDEMITIRSRTRTPAFHLSVSTGARSTGIISKYTLKVNNRSVTSEAYDFSSSVSTTIDFAPPAPAPAKFDPDFNARAFYPHVLQQLFYRDRALLTSILTSQGFTPTQIVTFIASVSEL